MKKHTQSGFTLLDLMIAMGIIGILAAIAIPIYYNYANRARASDIAVKYDGARSTANANIAGDTVVEQCEQLAKSFGVQTIADDYARIGYGFEAVSNGKEAGYRPVLTICSVAAQQGAQAVKVARAAHDELAKNTRIEGGAVLTDTIVSFALPLTDPTRVVCKTPPVSAPGTCGTPVAVPTPSAKAPSQTPTATPTPQTVLAPGAYTCPAGREAVFWTTVGTGKQNHACVPPCPSGQVRDPSKNPLDCNPASAATTPKAATMICPSGQHLVSWTDGAGTLQQYCVTLHPCPPGQHRLITDPTQCIPD